MVPITSVVLFFVRLIDPAFGRKILQIVAASLVPDTASADEVTDTIIEVGARANVDQLDGWGLLVVIVLAYWLFATLESTVNEIWRVKRRRRMITKFTMFYTLASLAPIVVLYSFAQPLLSKFTETVLVNPYLTTALALIFLNRFMPNTSVSWRAAIVGGLVSASLFELGKFGFGLYVSRVSMSTYESVYGGLAVWPVFLVWVYVSWMLVLLGLEVSFVVHHSKSVLREGFVPAQLRSEQLPPSTPGRTAARIMLAISDHGYKRRAPSNIELLTDRFGLGIGRTVQLVDFLEDAGLLVSVDGQRGYVPAEPLEHISLRRILGLFDGDLPNVRDDELSSMFASADNKTDEYLGDLTLADLVTSTRDQQVSSQAAVEAPGDQSPVP
jgi:membrane protein